MENELIHNLDKIHTTPLGIERMKRNLSLGAEEDVVDWCQRRICDKEAVITRKGKNWYVSVENCIITVNAYSYTLITAHRKKGV